jgi:hypothetical protein
MPFDDEAHGPSRERWKTDFDPTALDLVKRQRQFGFDHTLRNQGNRPPFNLASKRFPVATRALARI